MYIWTRSHSYYSVWWLYETSSPLRLVHLQTPLHRQQIAAVTRWTCLLFSLVCSTVFSCTHSIVSESLIQFSFILERDCHWPYNLHGDIPALIWKLCYLMFLCIYCPSVFFSLVLSMNGGHISPCPCRLSEVGVGLLCVLCRDGSPLD